MAAYYSENDPFAAAWLRELIAEGHIADGTVDERSITDVTPADLHGFTQCHFFAGIGGWSLALRLAGWPDDRPAWTGSCPCQPFSSAGAQAGGDDPRHLWPAWARLIRECHPPVVFGEQVESALAHGWLDLVFDDLEREGYACGAIGLPAACVGAPHIRQRLWFVGHAENRRRPHECDSDGPPGQHVGALPGATSGDGNGAGPARDRSTASRNARTTRVSRQFVAESDGAASERRAGSVPRAQAPSGGARQFDGDQPDGPEHGREADRVADADDAGRSEQRSIGLPAQSDASCGHNADRRHTPGPVADDDDARRGAGRASEAGDGGNAPRLEPARLRAPGPVGDAGGPERRPEAEGRPEAHDGPDAGREEAPSGQQLSREPSNRGVGDPDVVRSARISGSRETGTPEPGFWRDVLWLPCRDGKARPVEPTIQPLASGISNRVGLLRGAGNAIVPQVAQVFIEAYLAGLE